MTPLVSIIIPCYNQARFLPECIASLQAQTYVHWEAIIINDGSSDDTREVALDWCARDSRLRYVEQTNGGACGARNSGLREAKGELVQFLDADDQLEPDKFRTQVEFLELHPEIDIVFGDARYFTTDKPELRDYGVYAHGKEEPWIPALWQAPGTPLEKLLTRNLFPINCPLARRNVFRVVGEWNVRLERLQDWEYWIRCAAANMSIDFYNAPNSMALIRWHAASMTHDAAKGDRASLVMRIAVGQDIRDPGLRNKNYEMGLNKIRYSNPPNSTRQLIRLTYAHLTPKTFVTAMRFFFLEIIYLHWLLKPFEKWMPGPIQAFTKNFVKKYFRGRV